MGLYLAVAARRTFTTSCRKPVARVAQVVSADLKVRLPWILVTVAFVLLDSWLQQALDCPKAAQALQ